MTDHFTNLPVEVRQIITKHPDLESNDVMAIAKLNKKMDGMFSIIKPIWQRKKAAEVAAAWQDPGHIPSPSDVTIAALLAAHRDVVILPPEILIRKGEDIKISLDNNCPSIDVLRSGAALAKHGIITQLRRLVLCNLDISAVPAEDMASLVTCAQVSVMIDNVTGPLGPILGNVKCDILSINMVLGTEQTQSLVAAMVTGVKLVGLQGGVTLDLETLAQYDGTGECGRVRLWGTDFVEKYGEEVKEWGKKIGWGTDEGLFFGIKRVLQNIEADEDEGEMEDEGDDE